MSYWVYSDHTDVNNFRNKATLCEAGVLYQSIKIFSHVFRNLQLTMEQNFTWFLQDSDLWECFAQIELFMVLAMSKCKPANLSPKY